MLDKWLNTIQQGDCLELMKQLPDKCVDLVVTDCPYFIVAGGSTVPMGGIFSSEFARSGGMFEHNSIEFAEWLPEIYRLLKDGTHAYIMINGRNLAELQLEAQKVGFEYQNTLIWEKGTVTPNRYYMQQCEFILMLSKRPARTINKPGTSNIFHVQNNIRDKQHPTGKPVELMEAFIENSSNPNATVLDPFMGSGTTARACKDLGRNFIGFEINQKYVDIANKRLQQEVLL